ncbi:hypothetical protein MTBBW1_2510006 [Desulfamplus magnetovallimortis]|uniref:Uncharacterized protein n=1 Tax=Desulfamplus magnetovallimortis TaxID=1246637 RepID=A0A1W1HER5_9BACT|nr:hypothetical protein [Desulfamplus magnetovallimortis]SLM30888.1 hypothetical protein MTBBW1_2510006 [Desulfamplus magnetovallimortis]
MKHAEIKKCTDKDLVSLFKMFKDIYKANPNLQNKAYFDWQYKYTPFSKNQSEYTFYIQKENNKIVAFLGYLPIEYRYDQKIFNGCWLYNWYSTSQSMAGLKLLIHMLEKFDNLFLYGMTPTATAIYSRFQIPILNEMPRFLAILDEHGCIKNIKCQNRKDLTKSSVALSRYKDSGNIKQVERFDPEEEFLFEEWEDLKGYCRRTGAFLNWRFLDIPNHNYKCIYHLQGGYAVYRIEPIMYQNASVTRLIEWNFKGKNAEHALAYIIKDSKKKSSILIDFFSTSDAVGKELKRLGFIHEQEARKKRIPYLFRPLFLIEKGISVGIYQAPQNTKRHVNFNHWYITSGDGDMDRIKL